MDPIAVFKTLWHHKVIVLPVLLITALAALYVYSFAPRSYEAKATYAIVNPKIPTAAELEKNPALNSLNSDNPYLRSADSSLIAQVVGTRLSDDATGDALLRDGLSTDFTVQRPPASFLIELTAASESKDTSIATVKFLGTRLENDLRDIQSTNGADERYLYTSLMVSAPDNATEQFSSRLRSLIVVLVAGVVLTFGAVSIARGLETSRRKAREATTELTIQDVLGAPLSAPLHSRSKRKETVKETTS
ncbi:Wzz/FepE/Etk N-terminal domain-containing protein [Paenarthrobacter ilicis]|uniref:Capsular polysaccharide biosynthesis protein n=1 Tax=Paenarthrobacter ilicis TaxID=43665 RepID=A0ABX0THD9_9MICC|nr:Wzz/FepE/Etk N-terminal domain-containing protein [Paenarthrobacter ilicis]MBM7793282.1 capsular polysaccharide biosynthesis protein [Paenarthrobacter ilicis]NIJ01942.1 capsular polysaccharide biosynthesis protein [Paenarthrobacter ilicis]